jgi:hypothetical protein
MKFKAISRVALLLPLVALALAACTPKSNADRVAKLRTYYKARIIGFVVQAEPVAEVAPAAVDEDGATAASSADEPALAGDDDGAPMEEAVPEIRQDIMVDILLQHDSPQKLSGITLDIEMVDADQQPKGAWKVWVDTADLPKATGTQFTHVLEDVDYVEGDGFNVEVRTPVPAEERGEYREFSEPLDG